MNGRGKKTVFFNGKISYANCCVWMRPDDALWLLMRRMGLGTRDEDDDDEIGRERILIAVGAIIFFSSHSLSHSLILSIHLFPAVAPSSQCNFQSRFNIAYFIMDGRWQPQMLVYEVFCEALRPNEFIAH